MRTVFEAIVATALLTAGAQAQAGLVIDNFYNNAGTPDFGFPTVATQDYPGDAGDVFVASASSSTGTIVGGERDVRVQLTDSLVYQGDNDQGFALVQNGYFGPYNRGFAAFGVGLGASADFLIQYDGIDGSATPGAGLNLNAASQGNKIVLESFYNLIIGAPGMVTASPFTVRLTDTAGRNSSLTRSLPEGLNGTIIELSYEFSAFEAANSLFDISSIRMIEVVASLTNASDYNNFTYLSGIGIAGTAYSPTNAPGGPAEVPAPAMLGLFGLAALGLGLRRRARR